ncbi:MAG: hypothetical protein K6F05_04275 [Succinivibrio sp.]|nr:hypothetical protein [Succinivibrio sp.]
MKNRNSIRAEINSLYRTKVITWLTQYVKSGRIDGFPKRIYLGAPTHDDEILEHKDDFFNFCQDWRKELSSGQVDFLKKTYPQIGEVEVPIHLVFEKPDDVAKWAGHLVEYHSALERLDAVKQELPQMVDAALDHIKSLTSFENADFQRFLGVCKWVIHNRNSGKLIRQIPVRGVDNAWFEGHRSLLLDFLREQLELNPQRRDLLQIGLVPPSSLIRTVILDRNIRYEVGGLRYFAATADDLNSLNIKPERVVFMEDLSTILSVPDMERVVLIQVTPYTINQICKIKWIANAQCLYLGSIDLRSLAVLNNIRVHLPRTESRMLNVKTLEDNKDLLSFDDISASDLESPLALNAEEGKLYQMLAMGVYGAQARLAQERLPLSLIFDAIELHETKPVPLKHKLLIEPQTLREEDREDDGRQPEIISNSKTEPPQPSEQPTPAQKVMPNLLVSPLEDSK